MAATSVLSARFQDGHCIQQAAYTDWKAHLMKPFTSNLRDGAKRENGKVFHSHSFSTTSCPQLRPFYDLFYPAPARMRVFPASLSMLMTSLTLAVWYMDDGNVTAHGMPRIAFGLDDLSLQRAHKALVRLGLKPVCYGEGGDRAIHFPKQSMLFRELVGSHVPDCMQYKLPFESVGQAQHRQARQLAPEQARALYEGGMSVPLIASVYQVGESTVSRRLKTARVAKRSSGPRKSGHTVEAAAMLLDKYDPRQWGQLPESEQAQWVDEVFAILRGCPFPATLPFDEPTAQRVLKDLMEADLFLDGDARIQPIRKQGIALCNSFFPNRYNAISRGVHSAYETWHLDDPLKKAIRFQFKVGDPVLPHRVLRAITMACRTPSVFRPTIAKFIYERYCPVGGSTWDPCSGYGGRLLGAVAAGVRYVGTDVDAETVAGNTALTAILGSFTEVHLCPAEEFNPPAVDLVFTSPPYFNRELYSQGRMQSWRHGAFDQWVAGFLSSLVQKAHQALNVGGHLVLNVADVRDGKNTVPLEARTTSVALEAGFVLAERLKLPLPKLNRVDPHEPVLVFQKA